MKKLFHLVAVTARHSPNEVPNYNHHVLPTKQRDGLRVAEKIQAGEGNFLIPVTPWPHGGTSTASLSNK